VTDELSELVDTLRSLKEQSRRPAPTAYRDLIESASRFETHRLQPPYQGDEPSNVIPHESLGWDITRAALTDAKAGGIELSEDVYDIVASVGRTTGIWLMTIVHRTLPRLAPLRDDASARLVSCLGRILEPSVPHSDTFEQHRANHDDPPRDVESRRKTEHHDHRSHNSTML
jgi:hypothetical protein